MKTAKAIKLFSVLVAMLILSPGPAGAGVGIHLGIGSGSHSGADFGIQVSHGRHGHNRHFGKHHFGKRHFGGHSFGKHRFGSHYYGRHFNRHNGHGRHFYYGHRRYYRPHYSFSYRHYYGYPRYKPYGYTRVGHVGNYGYLQTDVTPEHAEVFINGKYYGTVAEFKGSVGYDDAKGSIALAPGNYDVEFRAAGYEKYTYTVTVSPERTITIVHDLGIP